MHHNNWHLMQDDGNGGFIAYTVWLISDSLTFVICITVALTLFWNLFELNRSWVSVQQSDKHNWNIEPSKTSKISSVLASLLFATYAAMAAMGYFCADLWSSYLVYIYIPQTIANLFKYIYLISRIKNLMDQEPLFKANINRKLWITAIILVSIKFVSWILYFGIFYIPTNGYPESNHRAIMITYVYETISVGSTLLIDFTLLKLYINGHSNIYKFWYCKYWKEHDKYGETQKGHEALIIITTDSVVTTIALVLSVIDSTTAGVIFRAFIHKGVSSLVNTIFNVISAIIRVFNIGSFVTASYFMYPFGYNHYRKCCDPCNAAMYECCEAYHHKQIDKGDFSYRQLNDEFL